MKLTELEPQFLKLDAVDPVGVHHYVSELAAADGISFQCPVCFQKNKGPVGTHYILCWRPHVPQTINPIPGRWEFFGTGYEDLELRAGSSSILIQGGCNAHFFIRGGQIQMC